MTSSGTAYTVGQQVLRRGGRMILDRQENLDISGHEHIPKTGPCVLVARHYHHLLDGCALYRVTDRPVHILVGLDWAGTGPLRRVMDTLCRMVGWPVILRPDALEQDGSPRRQDEARRLLREAMRQSVEVLSAGKILAIFPEGYPVVDPHAEQPRAEPDGLLPFQTGVAQLVRIAERQLDRKIPLVPVGFSYEQASDDRWEITMRIGAPVDRSGITTDADLLRVLECGVADLSCVSR